jgi:hypothetical protein
VISLVSGNGSDCGGNSDLICVGHGTFPQLVMYLCIPSPLYYDSVLLSTEITVFSTLVFFSFFIFVPLKSKVLQPTICLEDPLSKPVLSMGTPPNYGVVSLAKNI